MLLWSCHPRRICCQVRRSHLRIIAIPPHDTQFVQIIHMCLGLHLLSALSHCWRHMHILILNHLSCSVCPHFTNSHLCQPLLIHPVLTATTSIQQVPILSLTMPCLYTPATLHHRNHRPQTHSQHRNSNSASSSSNPNTGSPDSAFPGDSFVPNSAPSATALSGTVERVRPCICECISCVQTCVRNIANVFAIGGGG
jgi:hypothetical protein